MRNLGDVIFRLMMSLLIKPLYKTLKILNMVTPLTFLQESDIRLKGVNVGIYINSNFFRYNEISNFVSPKKKFIQVKYKTCMLKNLMRKI